MHAWQRLHGWQVTCRFGSLAACTVKGASDLPCTVKTLQQAASARTVERAKPCQHCIYGETAAAAGDGAND